MNANDFIDEVKQRLQAGNSEQRDTRRRSAGSPETHLQYLAKDAAQGPQTTRGPAVRHSRRARAGQRCRECYAALGIVHNMWSYLPGEFDDYIANPEGQQLPVAAHRGDRSRVARHRSADRTHEMHRHAELGVAAHWRYKEGGSRRQRSIARSASCGTCSNRAGAGRRPARPAARRRLRRRVSMRSVPKGDVVEMPANSTPLDFAYHVHTQVGHRCRGAKVNGRIVPLTYKVRTATRSRSSPASRRNPVATG